MARSDVGAKLQWNAIRGERLVESNCEPEIATHESAEKWVEVIILQLTECSDCIHHVLYGHVSPHTEGRPSFLHQGYVIFLT